MGLKIKEKDSVMGKAKQTMWIHHILTRFAADSSTFVSECLWFLRDTFTCGLDIEQDDKEWRAKDETWFFRLCIPGTGTKSCSEGRRGRCSLPHGESDATNCGNPRSWMHKSYGLVECSQCFCDYVDSHDCGLRYKIEQTSSRFFFANFQQTKCTEKLVTHMHDKAWNVHTKKFDIVEERSVPLLTSLPQMRNLGFQFGLSHKTRNLEASTQDVKEHAFSHGLPRHCFVYECSVFQNSWGDKFPFTAWMNTVNCLLPVQLMMTGKLTTTGRNWSVTTRHFVVNYSKPLVPNAQFLLMILNPLEQPSLRWRIAPRR